MENLIPIIIVCLIVAVISFYIGRTTIKQILPTIEQITAHNITDVRFLNIINPLVKEIYNHFTSNHNVKQYNEIYYNMIINDLKIEIWSANDIYNRAFTKLSDDILLKYNKTLKEINESLTLTDKTILDQIVQAVKVNNKEFIERIFIIK